MAPPIYPTNFSGTDAQQYIHRARMFQYAALGLPDNRNGETFWPKYALLTHALELTLKAFAKHVFENGRPATAKEPKQHDLQGWYDLALSIGLEDRPGVASDVEILNDLHLGHFTRYPQRRQVRDASVIAGSTVDLLIGIVTQTTNPR